MHKEFPNYGRPVSDEGDGDGDNSQLGADNEQRCPAELEVVHTNSGNGWADTTAQSKRGSPVVDTDDPLTKVTFIGTLGKFNKKLHVNLDFT